MVKRVNFLLFIGLAVMVCTFLGCSHDSGDTEPRYTVWTDSGPHSDFEQSFGVSLDDGNFLYLEFTDEQFSQMSPFLHGQDDYKHSWTKAQLKDWFIGRGFDDENANEWSAWLASINHGMIASRRGNLVDLIIK